jgi:hypothetical protein
MQCPSRARHHWWHQLGSVTHARVATHAVHTAAAGDGIVFESRPVPLIDANDGCSCLSLGCRRSWAAFESVRLLLLAAVPSLLLPPLLLFAQLLPH